MRKLFSVVIALCAATALSLAGNTATVNCGGSATITATPATGYHFVQWSDGNTNATRTITDIQADVTYTATFAKDQYTITFKDYDGTVLQTATYEYGDAVTAPTAPTRAADAQYTYEFDAWSPTISATAVANAEYVATYTQTLNQYTVTFKNYDGTVLESKKWDYGTTPSYADTPTKPADAGHTYVFNGWDATLSPVTGDVVYTAQFSATDLSYTITTTCDDAMGTTTGDGTYLYNKTVTITATAKACYRFVKWSDGDTNATRTVTVVGNATYQAIFEIITYNVSVVADPAEGGTVNVTAL